MSKNKTTKIQKDAVKLVKMVGAGPGLLIAAYPGMGQQVFTSIYETYKILSAHDYMGDDVDWYKKYAQDAIDMIKDKACDVCFIHPHKDVIKHLSELGQPFLIFYPTTNKEVVLERMSKIFKNTPSINAAKDIADVVSNYKEDIDELRLYPNSIAFSSGIVNDDLLKQLLGLNIKSRAQVMDALGVMKTTQKE